MFEDRRTARRTAWAAIFAILATAFADGARAGGSDERSPPAPKTAESRTVHRTPGTVRRADSFRVEDRYGLDATAGAYLTPPTPYVLDPSISIEIDARRWRRRDARAPR